MTGKVTASGQACSFKHEPVKRASENRKQNKTSVSPDRKPNNKGGTHKGASPSGRQDRPPSFNFKQEEVMWKDHGRDHWHLSESIHLKEAPSNLGDNHLCIHSLEERQESRRQKDERKDITYIDCERCDYVYSPPQEGTLRVFTLMFSNRCFHWCATQHYVSSSACAIVCV